MKQHVIVVLLMMAISISGCAKSLPPQEELNQAVKKSLDATGLNYSSKSRITNLSITKLDETDSDAKLSKYLDSSLGIIRGISINADGAVDMKAKKSEVLYELRYDKDNVEVSLKLPMMVDYNTQTIYVGTSVLNTILETVFPQAPSAKGKLIRIKLNDILQESAADAPELAKMLSENRFTPKNIDLINNAMKASIMKALTKLDKTSISEQPLTEQDRKAGVERRIHVSLGHKESVAVVTDVIDSVSQALYQEGVITKEEYAVLLTLTDKKTLDGFVDKVIVATIFDVGIARSGFINQMECQLDVADKEGSFKFGINNVSTFSSYNEPHFSLSPETSGIVDLKEIMNAIKADEKDAQSDSTSCDEESDDSEADDASQGQS